MYEVMFLAKFEVAVSEALITFHSCILTLSTVIQFPFGEA